MRELVTDVVLSKVARHCDRAGKSLQIDMASSIPEMFFPTALAFAEEVAAGLREMWPGHTYEVAMFETAHSGIEQLVILRKN